MDWLEFVKSIKEDDSERQEVEIGLFDDDSIILS